MPLWIHRIHTWKHEGTRISCICLSGYCILYIYIYNMYIYIHTHAFWPAQDLVLSELVLWRVSTKVSHDNTRENDFVFEGPPCLNLAVKAIVWDCLWVCKCHIHMICDIYIYTCAHIYRCTQSIVTQYWWWKCMVFVIEFVVPKRATTLSCLRVTWLWNGYSPALPESLRFRHIYTL